LTGESALIDKRQVKWFWRRWYAWWSFAKLC